MDLLNQLLVWLQAIDPKAAAIGAVILWLVQRLASKNANGGGGILDLLLNLFKPKTPAPGPSPAPQPAPSPFPFPLPSPSPGPVQPDPLANRPVLKGLRDLLDALMKQKFSDKTKTDSEALDKFQKVVAALEDKDGNGVPDVFEATLGGPKVG